MLVTTLGYAALSLGVFAFVMRFVHLAQGKVLKSAAPAVLWLILAAVLLLHP